MASILPRGAWGARSPRPSGRNTVTWRERTEFYVHHTDGPRGQSVRSIQDFHLDGRGWGDVGYNFLVRDDGTIYEGRGWLVVGAHCPDHNRSGIGVAFIGSNDPTPAAKRSIRWLYDEACRRAGRKLKQRCHGDSYPTECPGPRLRAWVKAGMPTTEEDDVSAQDVIHGRHIRNVEAGEKTDEDVSLAYYQQRIVNELETLRAELAELRAKLDQQPAP